MTQKSGKIVGWKTVSKDMRSWYDSKFKFEVGKTYEIKDVSKDGQPCGPGLHFCQNEKDWPEYCSDYNNYVLLQVEADKKDIIGQDHSKTRVSKLKVLKVLASYSVNGGARKKRNAEYKKLDEQLKNNKSLCSDQVLTKLFTELKKHDKKVKKLRVVDNEFEYQHWEDNEGLAIEYQFENLNVDVGVAPTSNLIVKSTIPEILNVNCYLGHHVTTIFGAHSQLDNPLFKENAKLVESYFNLLKAGAVPMGVYKDTLVVFRLPVVKRSTKKAKK